MKDLKILRILGIDYGDVRIGLALSDPTGLIAGGIGTVKITGMNNAVEQICKIISERQIEKIVLGLPLNMDGSEGPSAQKIRVFADKLKGSLPELDIELIDERRTSILAANYMDITETFGKKRKESVDTLSAQIILQTYLDKNRKI